MGTSPSLTSTTERASFSARLRDVLHLIRTRQWAKNLLIFAGFIFAGRLRESDISVLLSEGVRVFLAFLCFCALSGIAYVINDWADIERDRLHPVKRHRPLAAGRLSSRGALAIIAVLLLVAAAATILIWQLEAAAWGFSVAAILYFALTLSYSLWLKHEVVVDVLCVALGFVLRVVAGCLALPVAISPWIILCTFNLALFIALCKRRSELTELGDVSTETRRVLLEYSGPLLDILIAVAAGLSIVSYSLYTFTASHSRTLGASLGDSPLLMVTIPFVVYGVFRYLFLAFSSAVGGEPEQMLRDRRLMLNVALWVLTVIVLTILEKM